MTTAPQLRVLFFDVFGTCVAQRTPVADELWKAAKEALESDASSMSSEVRDKATETTYDQWFDFGGEWDREVDNFAKESITKHNSVDWRAVDTYRLQSLHTLLANRGLITSRHSDTTSSHFQVEPDSLWTESQLQHLARVWHRLPPWPDTCRGLDLLNQKFSTVTLSNAYNEILSLLHDSNTSFDINKIPDL
ncbi:hypothetical protein MMC10_010867 [Thelotrema lepadinum]|nr:hypothetical protein [Thelotrema lepadinum]